MQVRSGGVRRRQLILVAAAATVLLAAGEARAQAVQVTGRTVNLRAGPGDGHRVVGSVGAGEVYARLDARGAWVQLQVGADEVWCHGSLVRPHAAEILEVTAGWLNVRTGPSSRYRAFDSLPRGTRLAVTAADGPWRRADVGERPGWLHTDYLRSLGGGTPSGGNGAGTSAPSRPVSRAGFIQLPAAGPGFYGYFGADRRWGTPRFVYGIERIGRRWEQEQRGAPRFGVGDLSLRNGGRISGHVSHRMGVDVDVRPVRNDGREAPSTRFDRTYSRPLTQALLDLFVAEVPVTKIFFNDRSTRHTQPWPNHDNHFHVRIRR